MKRSPLKRGQPLKRSPMRRGKGRGRYARRERDLERMRWIRTQPCALVAATHGYLPVAVDMWLGAPPDRCSGAVEAHHAGEHGMGHKASDDTCISMCRHHHRMITGEPGGRGCFDGWPPGSVKHWELAAVAHYQRCYAERGDGGPF